MIKKTENKEKITHIISVENFSSWDTASIVFYKSSNDWGRIINYRRYGKKADTINCYNCKSKFTPESLDSIRILRTEVLSMNCRKYNDTIINGQHIGSIDDFYTTLHLPSEIIRIDTTTIKYLSPKEALLYCKDNSDRLKFIYMVDRLRSIK